MHDMEYDALQKKKIARSARNQKRGSRSRKCTLPSDYLTNAEKRKLNGEIMTYQINKPITWVEFKNYPIDIKKKYLEHFAAEHNCTIAMMEGMLGCGENALRGHIDRRPELQKILRHSSSRAARLKFAAWLETERWGATNSVQNEAEVVEEVVEEKVEEVVEEKPKEREVHYFGNCIRSGEIVVNGTPAEIGVALMNVFQNQRVAATIKFEVVEDA